MSNADYEPANAGVISESIYGLINPGSLAGDITALLLVFLQAVLINYYVMEHKVCREVNLFAGLLYVLLGSAFPEFLHLSPALIANTFIILAIGQIWAIYQRVSMADRIFNIGFWVAMASLCYFSSITLLLMGLLSLTILRVGNGKEYLMLLFGFLTPYILACTWYFWQEKLGWFWGEEVLSNFAFWDIKIPMTTGNVVKLSIFGVLLLTILVSYGSNLYKIKMEQQKKVKILYWGLFALLLTLFVQTGIDIHHLTLLMVPLSICMAMVFTNIPRNFSEMLHAMLLMGVIVYQYIQFMV